MSVLRLMALVIASSSVHEEPAEAVACRLLLRKVGGAGVGVVDVESDPPPLRCPMTSMAHPAGEEVGAPLQDALLVSGGEDGFQTGAKLFPRGPLDGPVTVGGEYAPTATDISGGPREGEAGRSAATGGDEDSLDDGEAACVVDASGWPSGLSCATKQP